MKKAQPNKQETKQDQPNTGTEAAPAVDAAESTEKPRRRTRTPRIGRTRRQTKKGDSVQAELPIENQETPAEPASNCAAPDPSPAAKTETPAALPSPSASAAPAAPAAPVAPATPPPPPEWPRMGKTAPGRQPQNPRILRVVLEEEVVNVQVRSNSFYRANEPVLVGVDAGGALVAARPKTNPLLHGGYEG